MVTLAVACAVLAVASGCGGSSKSVAGCGAPSSAHYLRYKAVAGPGDSVTPATLTATVRIMCKRIDNLGVKHMHVAVRPPNEIIIGSDTPFPLHEPVVSNTGLLEFYDWEPNLIGANGKYLLPGPPNDSTLINSNPLILGLFPAAEAASKAQPKAELTDIPPGGPSKQVVATYHGNQKAIQAYYDRKNDTSGTKYYAFAPGKGNARQVLRPGEQGTQRAGFTPGVNDANSYYPSCQEIANDYEGSAPTTSPRARGPRHPLKSLPKGTACAYTLKQLGNSGPPAGSTVVMVPQGITIVKAEAPRSGTQTAASNNSYYVLEDDSELSGSDITDPKQNFDPQTQEPDVTMNFTSRGKAAFARATKREAQRGSNILLPPGTPKQSAFQNFAITLDNQVVSLANISFVDNPDGISGDTGAQISGLGGIQETQDLAKNLRIGALPLQLVLVRFSP